MARRRGWTLLELVVAVALLAAVLAAAGSLFHTAAAVTARGQAAAGVLQEVAAIERQLRADFEAISSEGFLAIRCVAVDAPGGDAVIRADQVIFFTQGVRSIQTFRAGAGVNRRGQSTASRVYYGHAFQIPGAPPVEVPGPGDDVVWAIDPRVEPATALVPWLAGPVDLVRTRFQDRATDAPGDYVVEGDGPRHVVPPLPAHRWLLARQAVALAADGGSSAVFLYTLRGGGFRSTARIDDAVIRNGRVDAAASGLNEIRLGILGAGGDGVVDAWPAQRQRIAAALFYPRAERSAPGMHRVDQALTSHVLAGSCRSLIIEWTYGVDGPIPVDLTTEQPWFGLNATLRDHLASGPRPEFDPSSIEQWGDALTTPAGRAIRDAGGFVYEAVFGYDRRATPWPSALRFTMTLGDPGREVQLIVDLPRR